VTSFNNPVIPNKNNPDPGVIEFNGVYYLVATANLYEEANKFPIYKSTDL
jgi:hypothetical protein